VRQFDWEVSYGAEEYIRLLSTFSGRTAMEAWKRDGLYARFGVGLLSGVMAACVGIGARFCTLRGAAHGPLTSRCNNDHRAINVPFVGAINVNCGHVRSLGPAGQTPWLPCISLRTSEGSLVRSQLRPLFTQVRGMLCFPDVSVGS
jgi:hypothetical protein